MTEFPLRVMSIDRLDDAVRHYALAGREVLAAYAPGSHVVLRLGDAVNAYSLTDDGVRPSAYRISVRRSGGGAGSDWLHDEVRVGDTLMASAPISAFAPVAAARHHLLIAGGIGVTPILSHLRSAVRWNRSFRVVYGSHGPHAPHVETLRTLAGDRLTVVQGRGALQDAIDAALGRQPLGTHTYACGPVGMLEFVAARSRALGWLPGRVHVEHFQAPTLPAGVPFVVWVRNAGVRVEVPSGSSLLDALDGAGLRVNRMCRRGVCGQCRIAVRSGTPDHRDLILKGAERQAGTHMYPCVSRALSTELEIEL